MFHPERVLNLWYKYVSQTPHNPVQMMFPAFVYIRYSTTDITCLTSDNDYQALTTDAHAQCEFHPLRNCCLLMHDDSSNDDSSVHGGMYCDDKGKQCTFYRKGRPLTFVFRYLTFEVACHNSDKDFEVLIQGNTHILYFIFHEKWWSCRGH